MLNSSLISVRACFLSCCYTLNVSYTWGTTKMFRNKIFRILVKLQKCNNLPMVQPDSIFHDFQLNHMLSAIICSLYTLNSNDITRTLSGSCSVLSVALCKHLQPVAVGDDTSPKLLLGLCILLILHLGTLQAMQKSALV